VYHGAVGPIYICDDIGVLGKGPNDEMRGILMPNELKNAEHITVRSGLQ